MAQAQRGKRGNGVGSRRAHQRGSHGTLNASSGRTQRRGESTCLAHHPRQAVIIIREADRALVIGVVAVIVAPPTSLRADF